MATKTTKDAAAPEPKAKARSFKPTLPARLPRINRENWWIYLVSVLVALYLLLAIIFGIGIYRGGWSGKVTRAVSAVIPFPAATVHGSPIFYGMGGNSFLDDVDSIKRYYESAQKVNFNSKDGKTRLSFIKSQVLSQQIENKIIAQEAAKRHLKVTSKDVDAEYKKIVDANGGEAKVKDILHKYYNWDVSTFKTRIREQLLRQKLQTAIENDPAIDAQAKQKAESIKKQLKSDGSNFAELAKKYSEDGSASSGGDLGTADASSYVPEFAKAVTTLPVGQISDPVKTQYGYHIIQVLERNGTQVHARHILIKTKDFQTWLTEQESGKGIHKLIPLPQTASS